jgi:pimeloyl-ACP methyl ester carboxylesterase
MARAWDTLMKRLGYTRYVAQGGDWGAFVVDQMGLKAPAELLAIHTDMPATVPTDINNALSRGDPAPAGLSADEQHACQQLARDEILDNITLYWLTKTGVSASRHYWEYKGGFFNAKGVSIPVAVSVFPSEQYEAPRSWTERAYPKLIYYNRVEKGGHFAAWEQPMLFSSELRVAFRSIRKAA